MTPIRPIRRSTVVICAVLLTVVFSLLVREFYGALPRLSWVLPGTVGVVAAVEAGLAPSVRSRIRRKPGTTPIEALMVVRILALAKASVLVGTLLVGAYAGTLIYVVTAHDDLAAAASDTAPAAVSTVVSIALVSAALWLESACRAPDPPEDDIGSDRE